MKTKATFKILSILLSLAILCGMIMAPAFASNSELPDVSETEADALVCAIDGDDVVLPAEENIFSQPTEDNFYEMADAAGLQATTEEETMLQAAAAASNTGITSIRAYPLVRCEETSEYWYNTGIYAYKNWTTTYMSSGIFLTSAQFNNLNTRCQTYFDNKDNGLTYTLIGWRVVTDFYVSSTGTLKYTPASNCVQGTVEVSKTYYSGNQQIILYFIIDPSLTAYKYSGATGGWYPQSGTSLLFGTGIGVNSVNSANASTT